MKVDLPIRSYSWASRVSGAWLADRRRELPASGFRGRRARLPGLAWDLCQGALGDDTLGEDGSVLLGTALGCLTETAAFVENMIEQEGASPKPRAFTASVHNAIASEVARKLGARGECQTFVGGENAHVQALFAAAFARRRGLEARQLVGAVDEWTSYVERGRAVCEAEPSEAEGGALIHLGSGEEPGLARIGALFLARPANAREWLAKTLEAEAVEACFAPSKRGALVALPSIDTSRVAGEFPASAAIAIGFAASLLDGELAPETLDLASRPRKVAVVSTTRFGELGVVILESLA